MTGIEAIAFDLDMTLVDSRPVSRRALEQLVAEYDADLGIELLMSAYGLPLSRWLPPDMNRALFRRLQAHHIGSAVPMPGSHLALAAVRDIPARTVVVTSAPLAIAAGMLQACGLGVDRIRSGAWAAEKAEPIREEGCWAYVGDHADDMLAARQAGVIAVGVKTGSSRPLGADIELDDLTAFPAWLTHRTSPTP